MLLKSKFIGVVAGKQVETEKVFQIKVFFSYHNKEVLWLWKKPHICQKTQSLNHHVHSE